MKKTYMLAVIAAVIPAAALNAQNFNPKVEVTNTFETKAIDVKKQDVPMNVPDTLMQFTYNVDYSVFDNPYKGSYEFKPYMIEMRPDAKPSDVRKFFLRAGAGYTLHPELDLVWTPFMRHNLHISLYDTFRGYFGPYGNCMKAFDGSLLLPGIAHNPGTSGIGSFIFGKLPEHSGGYVYDNRAGVSLRHDGTELRVDADIAYRHLAAKDTLGSHRYQAAELSAKLLPYRTFGLGYFLGAQFRLTAGTDRIQEHETPATPHFITDLSASASFGGALADRSRVGADLDLSTSINRGLTDASAFVVSITPKYQVSTSRAELGVGARLSLLKSPSGGEIHYGHKSRVIYPDIRASWFAVPDRLRLYTSVTGGDFITSYPSLLERNPFIVKPAASASELPYRTVLDSSSETVNFKLGLNGTAGTHFQYDLYTTYVKYKNGLCDAVASDRYALAFPEFSPLLYGTVTYQDYDAFQAGVSFVWTSPRVDIDGQFRYRQTKFESVDELPVRAVADAPYQGRIAFTYNWNRRVFAGLNARLASTREGFELVTGDSVTVPGFVDLGVDLSFRATDRWTFWAKGGNLLNDAVQQYFLHCERGLNFTLGFCWNM